MEFKYFSKVNLDRCNTWHSLDDWSIDQWAVAVTGELGEACNKIKKLNRLKQNIQQANYSGTEDELIAQIGEEIADVFCYLDLLAQRCGLSLEDLVIEKFNAISRRENLPHRLP